MKESMKLYTAIISVSIFLILGMIYLRWYESPCQVTADCCGYQIDSSKLEQMRENHKEGSMEILAIAGWITKSNAMVTCPDTGRAGYTKVLIVDGPMELVISADILSGSYGAVGRDYCVLTESLAYELFGNTEAGGQISYCNKKLTVAAVIEKENSFLLIPAKFGLTENEPMENIAVRFQSKRGCKDKLKMLLEL